MRPHPVVMSLSLVAYCDSSDSETEDARADSDGKDGSQAAVKRLLSVLPPARSRGASRKQKLPVRIGLPKVAEREGDSDEEDATPVAKRPKAGGSGLSALLPQPKGAARQLGAGKKAMPMVPYTLTKRRPEIKKPLVRTRPLKSAAAEDSDSDDEPISFFPHLETPAEASIVTASQPPPPPSTELPLTGTEVHLQPAAYSSLHPSPASRCPPAEEPPTATHSTGYGGVYGFNSAVDPEAYQQTTPGAAGLRNRWFSQQYTPQRHQPVFHEEEEEGEEGESNGGSKPPPPPQSAMPGAGPGLSIDEESFRRLAGGKKRRDREENLNDIIELNEQEVKESIKTYQKYYSEETVNKLYKPDHSKIKAPTSDQKRKHQMTYLAHQAKEKELELRMRWSGESATRRQAAAKYGF